MAQAALDKAKEEGNMEEVDKQNKRLVKVTKEHVEEVKILLKHMGVPYVQVGWNYVRIVIQSVILAGRLEMPIVILIQSRHNKFRLSPKSRAICY